MYDADYVTEALEDFDYEDIDERSRPLPRARPRPGAMSPPRIVGMSPRQAPELSMLNAKYRELERNVKQLRADSIKLRAHQSKTDQAIRAMKKKLEMLVFLPLISKPKTETILVPGIGTQPPREVNVMVDSGNALSFLTPVLLMGSLGGNDMDTRDNENFDMTSLLLVMAVSNGGFGGKK